MFQLASTTATSVSINRHLLPREQQVVLVRQHPAVLIAPGAVVLAGLLAAGIVSATAVKGKENFVLAAWVASLLLLLYLISKAASWTVSYFVVTSERILLITGFLTRRIFQIPLGSINDIKINKSRGGLLLGFADFTIRTGGQNQVAQRIQYVPFPDHLLDTIHTLIYPDGLPRSLEP